MSPDAHAASRLANAVAMDWTWVDCTSSGIGSRPALAKICPDRINNKTNGITFRRWLYQANPELTAMMVDALGPDLLDNAEQRLIELEPFAEKTAFRKAFADQRLHSKKALAYLIHERLGIAVNPAAMFDVQVKRIHEYKRQLLNLLHTVALYQAIRAEPEIDWV